VTKPTPNFTRLGAGRPEIAILVDAMLRAREVVAARPPKNGGLTFWLILARGYATRVMLEGARAAGIEYKCRGAIQKVRADREVVLSAGAFATCSTV
jgi:choline dehydrogenase-like flavoprotein